MLPDERTRLEAILREIYDRNSITSMNQMIEDVQAVTGGGQEELSMA